MTKEIRPSNALHAADHGELRVLMLEDMPADAELCAFELKRAGLVFNSRRVDSRRDFEAALETYSPDLIISDYRLGDGRTGFDVIERLRSTFGAQIPAFLISGDTAPERLREASASGYYLLHKPVLPMTLRSVVSQLLNDHAERRAGPAAASRKSTDRESAAISSPALPPQ